MFDEVEGDAGISADIDVQCGYGALNCTCD
jgi:hypothetical protein